MATDTVSLPQGFVLDTDNQRQSTQQQSVNLPQGFVVDQQPQVNQQQIEQQRQGLFDVLSRPVKIPQPGAVGEFIGPTIELQARRKQQEQAAARQELLNSGLTEQQIDLSLKTKRLIGRPPIGRTAGAIAATLVAGRFIPGPVDDAAILAALIGAGSAGLGGVAGEAAQIGIEEKRLLGATEALKAFAVEAGA